MVLWSLPRRGGSGKAFLRVVTKRYIKNNGGQGDDLSKFRNAPKIYTNGKHNRVA
jgi:hypothetical protein